MQSLRTTLFPIVSLVGTLTLVPALAAAEEADHARNHPYWQQHEKRDARPEAERARTAAKEPYFEAQEKAVERAEEGKQSVRDQQPEAGIEGREHNQGE
jgi:hypothetical protein